MPGESWWWQGLAVHRVAQEHVPSWSDPVASSHDGMSGVRHTISGQGF